MTDSLARRVDATIGSKRSMQDMRSPPAMRRMGVPDLRNRLTGWLKRATACLGFEIASRAEREKREAVLADAHANAALWKARANAWASRVEVLEDRVAESQLVAMDLRARLVCLHGKLATTAATARYQRFTTALEGRAQEH